MAVVNHRHGTPDWMPIQLKLRDDLDEAMAAYKHYDVLLVNAMFDGMNLVAKEGPIVNEREGVSILSENTGAHEELGEYALSVNPFDIQELADSIYAALTMDREERAPPRARASRRSSPRAIPATGSTSSSPTSGRRRARASAAGPAAAAPRCGRPATCPDRMTAAAHPHTTSCCCSTRRPRTPTRAKIVADARAAIEAQGELLRHDEWGERALAYPIDRKARPREYHLLQFHAAARRAARRARPHAADHRRGAALPDHQAEAGRAGRAGHALRPLRAAPRARRRARARAHPPTQRRPQPRPAAPVAAAPAGEEAPPQPAEQQTADVAAADGS